MKARKIDETEYLLRSPRNAERLMSALERGRAIVVDHTAESASSTLPAFLAKPKGAPVYHGFKILDDVTVDGFTFGAITDFEAHPSNEGDAFVIAPDSSRAGLVWTHSSEPRFVQLCAPSEDRWGVFEVAFPYEMTSRENVKLNLENIIPQLRPKWEQWRQDASRNP